MKSTDKAEELIKKFSSKSAALKVVKEIEDALDAYANEIHSAPKLRDTFKYWEQVKTEIDKL